MGNWIKPKPNVYKVPAALWNKDIKYDVTELYGSNKKILTTYSRDEKGYRGFNNQVDEDIILTIGGSTTDQRYVSDDDTWQSFMEKNLPNNFNIINAGVDGQTTYGHLFSIKNWHSRELNNFKIPLIIFYIGINDTLLLNQGNQGLSGYDNLYKGKNIMNKIRVALSKNSFLYTEIKNAKNRFFNSISKIENRTVWAGHNTKSGPLTDPGIYKDIPEPNKKFGYDFYTQLVKNLILYTNKFFPDSKILIVQQAVALCKFESEKSVWNLSPSPKKQNEVEESYCVDVGQVFIAQSQVISEMDTSTRPSVLKLYLKNILDDASVYDFVHHNQLGSQKIGNALIPYVKEILEIN
tara:strand:- start:186 stop:1238 length:1053 start_codon:yes stop_codon:yes gene_type:complete